MDVPVRAKQLVGLYIGVLRHGGFADARGRGGSLSLCTVTKIGPTPALSLKARILRVTVSSIQGRATGLTLTLAAKCHRTPARATCQKVSSTAATFGQRTGPPKSTRALISPTLELCAVPPRTAAPTRPTIRHFLPQMSCASRLLKGVMSSITTPPPAAVACKSFGTWLDAVTSAHLHAVEACDSTLFFFTSFYMDFCRTFVLPFSIRHLSPPFNLFNTTMRFQIMSTFIQRPRCARCDRKRQCVFCSPTRRTRTAPLIAFLVVTKTTQSDPPPWALHPPPPTTHSRTQKSYA